MVPREMIEQAIRGFCPTCGGRTMVSQSMRWVGDISPKVPVRRGASRFHGVEDGCLLVIMIWHGVCLRLVCTPSFLDTSDGRKRGGTPIFSVALYLWCSTWNDGSFVWDDGSLDLVYNPQGLSFSGEQN